MGIYGHDYCWLLLALYCLYCIARQGREKEEIKEEKRDQHPDFQCCHQPQYYSGLLMLSFRERTGSGVFIRVWSIPQREMPFYVSSHIWDLTDFPPLFINYVLIPVLVYVLIHTHEHLVVDIDIAPVRRLEMHICFLSYSKYLSTFYLHIACSTLTSPLVKAAKRNLCSST